MQAADSQTNAIDAHDETQGVFHRWRPRYTLQRKLLWWTIVLTVTITFVCAAWLNSIAREIISNNHARNVELTAQPLAASLVGRLNFEPDARRRRQELLDTLELDPRLAFVSVVDRNDAVLERRIIDMTAWGDFEVHRRADIHRNGLVDVEQPIFLGSNSDLVVCRVPVLNPPLGMYGVGHVAPVDAKLEGYVTIGLRASGMAESIDRLRRMQLIASCAIFLLSLPVVMYAVRRWTAPLRSLLYATRKLARGHWPEPVPVDTRDELGLVAESFNSMAQRLASAQAQLRAANEDLEEKVRQRTAELEQVNARLQSEVDAKDEFLRAVSHDLGAPLRNITGMSRMLMMKHREELCDDALHKLERITANAKAQSDLIGEPLELSRIRSRPGKREVVDIHKLVEELTEQMEYDLQKSGIELVIEGRLPSVFAERNRMRQVFQNLIDNAVKYMDEKPDPCITISSEEDDDVVHLMVRDTGAGIAEVDLPYIFHMFRRGTHSGSHEKEGKGVGLANVKAIVENYRGRIWAESKLGVGSTFHFTLDRETVDPRLADREKSIVEV